jgi:hypothetical protein
MSKRDKLLTMKVTAEEKARWRSIAESRDLSLAELIRSHLDGLTPKKKRPPADPDLLRELNAVGNNLNQIARRLNQLESIDTLQLMVEIERDLKRVLHAHQVS